MISQLLAGLSERTSGSICIQKYDDSGNPIGLSEVVMALLEGGRERAGRGPFCPRPGKREGISFLILA